MEIEPSKLEIIRRRIDAARSRGPHAAPQVTLVAVTKGFGTAALEAGYGAGLRIFGESRVQEAARKLPAFGGRKTSEVRLIGHLQSNKVKTALELFDLIESVDSVKLLRRIQRLAGEAGRVLPVYLQVNAGHDPAKHGLDPAEVPGLLPELQSLQHVQVTGVMTIAPLTSDEARLRDCFASARQIRDELRQALPACADLSMGMSGDYELAIEEGATHIRLGTALFGPRP